MLFREKHFSLSQYFPALMEMDLTRNALEQFDPEALWTSTLYDQQPHS
jgi:hypothetical protein